MKPFLVLPALLLAACAAAPAAPPAAPERAVTASGRVVQKAFGLQAAAEPVDETHLRVPYQLRRVTRLAIFLKDETHAGDWTSMGDLGWTHGTPATTDDDADHVFDPIVLQSLKAVTDYRVRLEAWMDDPATAEVVAIRVDLNDAGESETAFSTRAHTLLPLTDGADERLDIDALTGGFALTLRNQPFSGEATGNSLNVKDGVLKHEGAEGAGSVTPH